MAGQETQGILPALFLAALTNAFQNASYTNIETLKETQSGFYQPVIFAQGGRKAEQKKG
jgi:hypothetical protein